MINNLDSKSLPELIRPAGVSLSSLMICDWRCQCLKTVLWTYPRISHQSHFHSSRPKDRTSFTVTHFLTLLAEVDTSHCCLLPSFDTFVLSLRAPCPAAYGPVPRLYSGPLQWQVWRDASNNLESEYWPWELVIILTSDFRHHLQFSGVHNSRAIPLLRMLSSSPCRWYREEDAVLSWGITTDKGITMESP